MKDRMIYQVDETRNRILIEAEKIFREKGFFEAQMKDVATATGMSRHTLYRYFRDKNDLAIKVIEKKLIDHSEKNNDFLNKILKAGDKTGLEKLEAFLKKAWVENEEALDSKLVAEFDAYFSGKGITEDLKESILLFDVQKFIEPVITLIDEGKADGSIRAELDSHLTYVTIVNAIRALKQRIILRGDVLVETTEEETEQMPPFLLDILIKGIKGESKSGK